MKLRDSGKQENIHIQNKTGNKWKASEDKGCQEMQNLVITQNKWKQENMHRQAKPSYRIPHFPYCSISILYLLVFYSSKWPYLQSVSVQIIENR